MSPSRKSAGPRGPRKTHALRRHGPRPAPLAHHIVALDAIGWRVVELRPSRTDGEITLWHVAITRVDLDASMTATATEPEAALADLVRYASADAEQAR